MSFIFFLFAFLLASAGFLLALMLTAETVAALIGGSPDHAHKTPGRIVVIIPAHNEAGIIKATVENLRGQLRNSDRMLVVADNCTDDTAAIALAAGASVVTRDDPARRGKGYALQFALDHLRAAPPAIVVFMDADCTFAPGALQLISEVAAGEDRPAQALYLMNAPEGAGPRLEAAAFAWAFINQVRMRGLSEIFRATRFTGAGLALPWDTIDAIDLGSGEIVEDLALTFALIRGDAAPLLVEDALVESVFPADEAALTRQSARWSIGSLRYSWRASIAAIIEGFKTSNIALIGAALDLMIPPLTVFVAALGAVFLISVFAWGWSGHKAAFSLSVWALMLTAASIVAGWARFGREILPPSSLRGLVDLVLSKLAVFGAKGRESAKRWTPTRGGDEAGQ